MTSKVKFNKYYEEMMGRFLVESAYDKQPILENSVKSTIENIFFTNLLKKDGDEDNFDM